MTAPVSSGALPRPGAAAPRDYNFPKFTQDRLSNGVRVIVAPVPKLPIVTMMAVIDAGAAREVGGKEGVAALTARLLQEGTAEMDGTALADRFERIGAAVEAHADWDVTVASLTVLSSRFAEAAALFGAMVRTPAFPEREVQRLKEERLADLLQQLTEPRTLADDRFSDAVYAANARYALPEAGSTSTVRTLTRDDVQSFHNAFYRPASTTLVLAGDITQGDALELAKKLFGDWSASPAAASPAGVDAARSGRIVRVVGKADAPQSEVRVGHRGLPRRIPDYFGTMVMNAVLGGLFSSRINLNLREAHGYTYGATSLFDWRRAAGPFVVSSAVKSEVTGAAVKEILLEIERMRAEPISNDELTLATSYLDGVFPIRYETTSAIASALANMVIYELPADYYDAYRQHVRSVTTTDVLEAARAHLDLEHMHIVVVGDPAVVTSQLADVAGVQVDVVRADDEGATR